MEWTRVTDPDEATRLFPAWFSGRIIGARRAFGLFLATDDVMRITSVMALYASDGTVLADVLLDHAGPPESVDLAWRTKHFLGAPVPGATMATVNLAHVVTAVSSSLPRSSNLPWVRLVRLVTNCRRTLVVGQQWVSPLISTTVR
jgi:hypothetical protein